MTDSSRETDISARLAAAMSPYFADGAPVDFQAMWIADLGISGSDYLDLVSDLEKEFSVDLSDFLTGPHPENVSMGWIGWLAGEPKKPVYRDVSTSELQRFLELQ